MNHTSLSNINLSPPTPSLPAAAEAFPPFAEIRAYRMTREERRQEMDDCREFVKEQIAYEYLVRENPGDQRRIDGYVDVLTEALCCEDEYMRIGQQEHSTFEVRERLPRYGTGQRRFLRLELLRPGFLRIQVFQLPKEQLRRLRRRLWRVLQR